MRPSLMAVSTASDPDEVRNTREPGIGERSATRAESSSAGSLVKMSNALYAAIRDICAAAASFSSRRPWPTAQYQRLAMPST
jgi:hypothetical protein